MKKTILICFLILASTLYSQGENGCQILITTENDFLGIDNKDENYTGSFKAELLIPEIKKLWQPFFTYTDPSTVNVQRFGIGGLAYTPQDIAESEVVVGDRPFASLMFLNIGKTSYNKEQNRIFQSDLIIGVMGAEGPGSVQSYLHRKHFLGSQRPIPNGWDNQIGEGGKLVVNYNIILQEFLFQTDRNPDFKWLQGNIVGKVDFGNYMINLQGGIKFNILNVNAGLLQDYMYNMPGVTANATERKKVRFNLFAEPHIRIAAYNATLEGLMFGGKSKYEINHSDVERLLFEINAGANLLLWDFLYLKYSFYGRSREFTGGKIFHSWGSITVGVSPSKWQSRNSHSIN